MENRVLSEIENCFSHHGFCVLPRNPGHLRVSPWNLPDPGAHQGVLWRQNVGGITQSYKGKKRFFRLGIPGLPDFIGWEFKTARFIAIEAKMPLKRSGKALEGSASPGKDLSPHQVSFGVLARATGLLYAVVRSYEECEKVIKGWRV